MSCPVITVENLSKAYRIGLKDSMHDTFVGAVKGIFNAPFKNWRRLSRLDTFRNNGDADDIFWALKDVSFEVQEGEVLGIIGRNGAGKSTLLKILSRITEPTSGRAIIRGRVASLLEVGTGFHPELTGRENIYMNGTILGMTKREIDSKLDQIIDFSGVERFLDTPVKRYSSGMKVRLAFAVAAHLEPEILIIDEVLAVGDMQFQRKCLGKMQDVARSGRTVLFVSHNMPTVEALCTHGVELHEGRIVSEGEIVSVIEDYRLRLVVGGAEAVAKFPNAKYIDQVEIFDVRGKPISMAPIGQDLEVHMTFAEGASVAAPRLFVHITDLFGAHVLTVQTPASEDVIGQLRNKAVIICRIREIPIAPGEYSLSAVLMENRQILEHHRDCLRLTITNAEVFNEGRGFVRGLCVARSTWSVTHNGHRHCDSLNSLPVAETA